MNSKTRPKISIATTDHIPSIFEIERKTWVETYPNEELSITTDDVSARFDSKFKKTRSEEIRQEIANKAHSYRVATLKYEKVGYSHLLKEEGYNDFVELYILPSFHGQGIGGILIRDALSWFGENKPIRLEVVNYNFHAIEIYKHYGFRENPNLRQPPEETWNVLPSGLRIPVLFLEKSN